MELNEIKEIIEKTDEKIEEKIDWTSAWGKKYSILLQYQKEVDIPAYARRINLMLDELKWTFWRAPTISCPLTSITVP